jgi:hypothetical protein
MSFHHLIRRKSSRKRTGAAPVSTLYAAVSLLLAACLSGPDRDNPHDGSGGGAAVTLQLFPEALTKPGLGKTAAARPTDSVQVRISGTGMDTLTFGFGGLAQGGQNLSLIDLPPGTDRRFEVGLYHQGLLLYAGETTVEIRTDRKNTVAIACLPQFSRLTASIHIPVDFPKAVAGGELRVWDSTRTFIATPVTAGELRHFRLEEVPGDLDYSISIALWDSQGDTLAKGHRAVLRVPKGENVALVMPLDLAFSQVTITMTTGDPAATTLVLGLPGGRRAPASFGDAVFAEFNAAPAVEDGGDNGEWLELFNRAADTLDVGGCQIVRDAGTGTGMHFALPAGTVIAPGGALVVGRSAVTFAHVTQATALTLTNTAARLEFSCNGGAMGTVRVDTLRYATSASDSLAARLVAGKVTSLKPSRLGTRHAADAWCQTTPLRGAEDPGATPGALVGSCGE